MKFIRNFVRDLVIYIYEIKEYYNINQVSTLSVKYIKLIDETIEFSIEIESTLYEYIKNDESNFNNYLINLFNYNTRFADMELSNLIVNINYDKIIINISANITIPPYINNIENESVKKVMKSYDIFFVITDIIPYKYDARNFLENNITKLPI